MPTQFTVHPLQSLSLDTSNDRSPLRNPPLDATAHVWIAMVVLIPIIFMIILCIFITCIYRYKKRRGHQNPMTSIGRNNVPISTIVSNSQRNPFVLEEVPPSYDIISETKKDLQFMRNEHFQLSPTKDEMRFTPPPAYNSDIINPTKL